MKTPSQRMHIISLTDQSNGAENVLLKLAIVVKGNLIFLKKSRQFGLNIPKNLMHKYLTNQSIFLGMLKLIPLLRRFKANEIVLSTHPYLNAYLGFLKRIGLLRSQLIVRECTSVFTRFKGFKKKAYLIIYKLGYPAVDLVICQTEIMRKQLLQYNSFINPNRVSVQPNPVDCEQLFTLGKEENLGCKVSESFVCTAGRLIPEKGFDILIKAFKRIHLIYPELKLYIYGEGNEKLALTQLIADCNLQEVVFLKGYIANPAPYFKRAELCVVSSINEGFPNVLLEMMALNPRVVSTLCAGGIHSIPNIHTVEVGQVEALAEAIQNTLAQPKISQENIHLEYLKQRNPTNFAQSILRALVQVR